MRQSSLTFTYDSACMQCELPWDELHVGCSRQRIRNKFQ